LVLNESHEGSYDAGKKTTNLDAHSGAQGILKIKLERLETQANTELDHTPGKSRRESQRDTRRNRPAPGKNTSGPQSMYVKRSECGRKAEQRPHFVIDVRKICPVRNVKSFPRELQIGSLAQLVVPAQACIEDHIIRAKAGIARRANWPLISCVVIAVYLPSSQQIERMSAVIGEYGS